MEREDSLIQMEIYITVIGKLVKLKVVDNTPIGMVGSRIAKGRKIKMMMIIIKKD